MAILNFGRWWVALIPLVADQLTHFLSARFIVSHMNEAGFFRSRYMLSSLSYTESNFNHGFKMWCGV